MRVSTRLLLPVLLAAAAASACTRAEPPPSTPATPAAVTVTMTPWLTFRPETVRIQPGQTVEWRNRSFIGQTVTADGGKDPRSGLISLPLGGAPFDSGPIPPGGVYRRTFEQAGVFGYASERYSGFPGMGGTIEVDP